MKQLLRTPCQVLVRRVIVVIFASLALLTACGGPQPPPPVMADSHSSRAAEDADGGSPVVVTAAPSEAKPALPVSPTDVVQQQRAALDACYADARAANTALGRTAVDIAFNIGADGRPITVDLQYRNRIDDKAKECMRDAALALRFPPSMEGRQKVHLPLGP